MEDKFLLKLKKLLTKAENAKELGNLEESEIFFGKVSELLLKHNLEISDLDFEIPQPENKIVEDQFDDRIKYGEIIMEGIEWERELMDIVAEAHFCKRLFSTYRGIYHFHDNYYPRLQVIGTEENIALVKYFYVVIRDKFRELSKKAYTDKVNEIRNNFCVWAIDKEDAVHKMRDMYGHHFLEEDIICDYSYTIQENGRRKHTLKSPFNFGLMNDRSVFIKSFLRGANYGLKKKFQEEKAKLQEEVGEKITALVCLNQKKLNEFLSKKNINYIKGENNNKTDSHAFQAGFQVGKNVSVGSGIGNSNSNGNKMLKL